MKRHRMTFAGLDISFREPTSVAVVHAKMAMREKRPTVKAARALTFLQTCLDESSYDAVQERVHDHDDQFDIDELVELMGIVADPTHIGDTPSTKGAPSE